MQKFSEISVGDYIVAKTSVTRKTDLPFENPNNNNISVMRIKAVGVVERISVEECSLAVNLLKDYRQEKKEWFFYTSKEAIWQPNISIFYDESVGFLLQKYGPAQDDYFRGKSYQRSMNQELKDSTKESLQERVRV